MDELLIEKVREHEILYNHGLQDYRDQLIRQTAWNEIGKELQISGNQAKQRWENLRRCFCNARNRRHNEKKSGSAYKKKSSWKFEQKMSYIIPFVESRKRQEHLNESNLVAEPEDLCEEFEAQGIIPSQIDRENEQDAQDGQATEIDSASNKAENNEECNKAVKRFKKQKQNTSPAGQLVEILKESSASRKRQYEEKKTHQIVSKPVSVLETLDDTDLFFLSMSRMTKRLPKLEQSQIKLALSNSVLSTEVRCNSSINHQNHQLFSTTPHPCSIQPQSHVSSPPSALSQEYTSGE